MGKNRETQDLTVRRFRPWHLIPTPLFIGLHTAFLHCQCPKSITPSIFPCGWSTHAPAASLTATACWIGKFDQNNYVHITPIYTHHIPSHSHVSATRPLPLHVWPLLLPIVAPDYAMSSNGWGPKSYDSKDVTDWFMETICFLPEYGIQCIPFISLSILQRRQHCKPSCSTKYCILKSTSSSCKFVAPPAHHLKDGFGSGTVGNIQLWLPQVQLLVLKFGFFFIHMSCWICHFSSQFCSRSFSLLWIGWLSRDGYWCNMRISPLIGTSFA